MSNSKTETAADTGESHFDRQPNKRLGVRLDGSILVKYYIDPYNGPHHSKGDYVICNPCPVDHIYTVTPAQFAADYIGPLKR